MLAVFHASVTHAWCKEYAAANAQADEGRKVLGITPRQRAWCGWCDQGKKRQGHDIDKA
jgi:hypothetical protein